MISLILMIIIITHLYRLPHLSSPALIYLMPLVTRLQTKCSLFYILKSYSYFLFLIISLLLSPLSFKMHFFYYFLTFLHRKHNPVLSETSLAHCLHIPYSKSSKQFEGIFRN